MARVQYFGKTTASTSVTVYWAGTTTKPTIYGSATGSSISNPLTSSFEGDYSFWVDEGHYKILNGKLVNGVATNIDDAYILASQGAEPTASKSSLAPFQNNSAANVEAWVEGAHTGSTYLTSSALKTATGAVVISSATAPTVGQVLTATSATAATWQTGGGGGGAPGGADTQLQYNNAGTFGGITGATTDGTKVTLVAPILGTPTSGTLTNCTGLPISSGVSGMAAGVATFLATPSSANLATAVTDETGTGALVFANTPTLVTPILGTPTSGTLTNCTGTASGLTAGNATNIGITDDTTTNATMYPTWVTTTTGNLPAKVSSSKLTFNPSTGTLTATTFSGAFSGTATNATNVGVTDDTTTNATMYLAWVTANTGNLPIKVSSTALSWNPSTAALAHTGGAYTNTQAVAATSTDGVCLVTSNTATVGAQKWSPRMRWKGSGWGTTGSAAQSCEWIAEAVPVQGTVPTVGLSFSKSVNGAAFTEQIRMDVTSAQCANVPHLFIGQANLHDRGSGQLEIGDGSASHYYFASARLNLDNVYLGYSAGGFGSGTSDLILARDAAATLRLGLTAANPPVAQTIAVQDASGTDIAGATWTFRGSRGTGTGTPGSIAFQTSTALGTGTTLQTATTRLTISSTAVTSTLPVVVPGYTVANLPTGVTGMRAYVTDANATTFLSTVAGGGANVVPVFYNGANWVIG